jgi:CubicO group peptidase (beta-lactamase class C family)
MLYRETIICRRSIKTFTTLAVLQLSEKGKPSIKDKAWKWLPEAGIDDQIILSVS